MMLKIFIAMLVVLAIVQAYDPTDKEIETIIRDDGTFEAFYPRETNGNVNSVARAAHSHGSFFQNRNPGKPVQLQVAQESDANSNRKIFLYSSDWRQKLGRLWIPLWWKKKIQFWLNILLFNDSFMLHGLSVHEIKLFSLSTFKSRS